MGITGLLPLLKSVTKQVHLEDYAGQTVAIDAYSWLHKGVYSCVADLYHQRPTKAFVEYCMNRVRQLRHFRINPILVFDGGPLPMKLHRETQRATSRFENRRKAEQFLEANAHAKAHEFMAKCTDVTPEMALMLIEALRAANIEFVVAPYEADAQMAYLERIGKVSAIISEDSDLLLFGCRRVLYKLDKNGNADEVCLDKLAGCTEIDLRGFTLKKFRQMCILSGCDYLPSLGGVGIKTIHKLFIKHHNIDGVMCALRRDHNKLITPEYEQEFLKAELTFQHQRVYCPNTRKLTTLTPLPHNLFAGFDLDCSTDFLDNLDFLGPILDDEIARGVAEGILNPVTYEPFKPEQIVIPQVVAIPIVASKNKTPVKLAPLLNHSLENVPRLSLSRSYSSQSVSQAIPRYQLPTNVPARVAKVKAKKHDENLDPKQPSILNFLQRR